MKEKIAQNSQSLFVVYYTDSTPRYGDIVAICEKRSTAERITKAQPNVYTWKETQVYRIGFSLFMQIESNCIIAPQSIDLIEEEKRIKLEASTAKKHTVLEKARSLGLTEEEISVIAS